MIASYVTITYKKNQKNSKRLAPATAGRVQDVYIYHRKFTEFAWTAQDRNETKKKKKKKKKKNNGKPENDEM